MKIIARTTYTVNGGSAQEKDISLTVSDDWQDDAVGRYAVMSKAADTLIEEGQIMISSVEIFPAEEAQAA